MNRLEACKIEREHIEQLGAMLNCRRPMISKEEKLEYSRTYALANCKDYYRENREAILLQKKRYYENTKLSNQLKKETAREGNGRSRRKI